MAILPPCNWRPIRANLADRFALPLECLLAVFIGAPLGIVYNRSGVIGAVAAPSVLLVIMIMAHYFFVMLGKGMRINPFISLPWIPDIALGFVGWPDLALVPVDQPRFPEIHFLPSRR